MDPLSFTASILTVIGVAGAGVKGIRKLNGYRNAPHELEELAAELEGVQALLQDMKSFVELNQRALYSESLHECVKRAATKILSVNTILDTTSLKLRGLSDANQARLIWIRYKHRLITLHDDLQVVRMDLAVRLGLVTASASYRTGESLSVSICSQNKFSDQLSMIIEKMTPPSDKTRDSSESSATLLSANDSGDESRSSSPGFPSSISDSRRPSAVEIPTLERPGLYQQEALIERVPNPMAEKCLPWCSCSCHARRSFTTPLILRTVLGEINVQYRGKRQECDEFNCRRSANFSLSLKYDLPKYLMSRYIVMAMRCVPLEGPQLSLRMPRVMRWSHPLWNYANSNDVLAIQKLFSEGKASPHDVNPHGSNALIYAAGHNNLQLSQFLLQQSADPDLPNGYGRTAAEMLWERSFAGHLGPEDTCRIGIMLKDHDNVETWRFSTLHKIVLGLVYRDLRSELDVSTASLNAGDSWGRTPLCWAAIRNDLNSLNILLEFGADSNATDESGHTPLHFVQSAEVCTALLAAKININILNEGSKSPLHQFCRGIVRRDLRPSSVSVIDLLIDAGIPVNVRDDSGETPLMNAIHAGLLDYARRLVFHGADPNAFNYGWGGDTAIHFAVRWDRWEIIPLLLEKGADYTALNFSDRNIAHLATQCGSARTMSVLASSSLTQLDVSLKDKNGMTPGEYMAERLICAESEEGIREEYQRLLGSIPAEKIASARVSSTGTLIDLESQADLKGCHVPGAFLDHFDGISVS